MAQQKKQNKAARPGGRRPKKKPRTLETTVTEIAQRPAPIRRSIFDLLDTLISSREKPKGEDVDHPADRGEDPPASGRKGRAR